LAIFGAGVHRFTCVSNLFQTVEFIFRHLYSLAKTRRLHCLWKLKSLFACSQEPAISLLSCATSCHYSLLKSILTSLWGARGRVVVKALCYKPEGRGFETRWSEWLLSIYLILPVALGPGVYSASNRNEYQKHKNVSGE
jgi:hypothetical protein